MTAVFFGFLVTAVGHGVVPQTIGSECGEALLGIHPWIGSGIGHKAGGDATVGVQYGVQALLTPAEVGDTFHVAEPEGESVTGSTVSILEAGFKGSGEAGAMAPHGGTHPSAPCARLTIGHQLQIALTERIVDLGGAVHGDTRLADPAYRSWWNNPILRGQRRW